MYKIGVIAEEEDILLLFKSLNIELFKAYDSKEAKNILEKITQREDFGIILLTETLAYKLEEELKYFQKLFLPSIVIIPTIASNLNLSGLKLKEVMKKAIGVDLFKGK